MIDPQEGCERVFIATPASTIYSNYMASIVRAMPLLIFGGVPADFYLLSGHAHVDDARNVCVGAFLKTNCDALIFVDADVGFPAEALLRLARHKGDIVAGVYPRKEVARSWPVKFEDGAVLEEGEDGLVREGIAGLPTGFMKISRRVLEAMAEIDPRRFTDAGVEAPIIFERGFHNGERTSGDYEFCLKAKTLGFELALDPHLPFTHRGEFNFAGRMIDEWHKQPTETPS